MVKLNLNAVEARVKPLAGRDSYDREFIFDLLLAYGKPQGNVTRLRNGQLNIADDPATEIAQKNVVYFKETTGVLLETIEELKTSPTAVRYRTRFVIVTDYNEVFAADTKTNETIGFPLREIDQHFTFFLPWAGMEKAQYTAEAHADVKAAERMGKLFDELLGANPDLLDAPNGRHALNIFFTRLLFCFFAEDTGIFGDNQFTNAVGSHTHVDGSDVAEFLTSLFTALDTANDEDKPAHLRAFPYVNGRLFTMSPDHVVPKFTKKAREQLLEAGTLIWQEINPDIFGSMFQAIVTPGKRSDLGQHYTSVPNILKTIEPLFLDDLNAELNAAYDSERRLMRLLDRIAEIKVFDPACGSGNFLVIAYKELRKLEHTILERLAELSQTHQVLWSDSRISIENFYGLEIDDFAVEVAILSLWIAKHQMNREFREKFSIEIPLIPLKETGQIRHGNATVTDWNQVCPNDDSEIYLIGNPPYVGSSMQTAEQKAEFSAVFGRRPFSKNLDYISLWFVKGADYIVNTRAQLAFVTTNSVAQGEHVSLMFPTIFDLGIEIGFAYTSFKWENNAKRNAGVTVCVISLRNKSQAQRYIYTDDVQIAADNINGYLADAPNIIAGRQMTPISPALPPMAFGSKPTDGGYLILDPQERTKILDRSPESARFIKRYSGSAEYINDIERYCLWIEASEVADAMKIPAIKTRLDALRNWRLESKAQSTRDFADRSYRFKQLAYRPTDAIIVPSVSSERRAYIPMGYVGPDTVISNLAYAVYDAEPWIFALLTSAMHMAWTRAVGGQLETRLRYSNTIVYNNFPVPPISERLKEELNQAALRVLDVREYHSEMTLAEMYDPDSMPDDLRAAHAAVDQLVDSIYSKKPYETDEKRLSDLFVLFEKMSAEAEAKSPRKRPRKATA